MLTRRAFLHTTGAALTSAARFTDDSVARTRDASAAVQDRAPDAVARDEDYWREIQQGFTLDRTIINLNNGGVCPSPRVVHEAFKRYLDLSNQSPSYHMWQILEPNIEGVRRRLAGAFGCDRRRAGDHAQRERGAPDRAARARRCKRGRRSRHHQPGLRPHARHLGAAGQRRDGIKLTQVSFPVPPPSLDDLADRLLAAHHRRRRRCCTSATSRTSPDRSSRCADLRRGASPRHQDDRRRRARVRALPVQGGRSGVRLLRHEPAQVAAGADRHRLPLRAPGRDCRAVAADAGGGDQDERHPQVRGDRHASRRRTTTRSPRRCPFTRASAASGRRRGCGICGTGGRRGSPPTPR